MKRFFKKILTNRDGNIAIATAIMLPVLIAFVSLGVDTTNFFKKKQQLTDASDAALVFGAKYYEELRDKGYSTRTAEYQASYQAAIAFYNQTFDEERFQYQRISFKEGQDGIVTGKHRYAIYPGFFFDRFVSNKKWVKISNNAEIVFGGATPSQERYIDLTLVIDNSASLGIGASVRDQQIMHAATGCTFACHIPRETYETGNEPSVARAAGAELRIDVLRDAAINAINELKKENPNNNSDEKVRISIYTFSNRVQTLTEPTNNLSHAIRDLRKLDLASELNTPENIFGGTNIDDAMSFINRELDKRKVSDTRRREQERESYVLLFTDGIENDTYHSFNGDELYKTGTQAARDFIIDAGREAELARFFETLPGTKRYILTLDDPDIPVKNPRIDYTQIFERDECEAIKQDGHTLITLQTFYDVTPELKSHPFSIGPGTFIQNRERALQIQFEKCASSDEDYYLVNDADDMNEKFKEALLGTLGGGEEEGLRLSQ